MSNRNVQRFPLEVIRSDMLMGVALIQVVFVGVSYGLVYLFDNVGWFACAVATLVVFFLYNRFMKFFFTYHIMRVYAASVELEKLKQIVQNSDND